MQRQAGGSTRTQTRTETTGAAPRLVLRAGGAREAAAESGRRVHWSEETCDNEELNKKSSKICCIYHPPTEFGESSGEEEEDIETDSEAEELAAQAGRGCGHHHSRPNAYERQPKGKRTKE